MFAADLKNYSYWLRACITMCSLCKKRVYLDPPLGCFGHEKSNTYDKTIFWIHG